MDGSSNERGRGTYPFHTQEIYFIENLTKKENKQVRIIIGNTFLKSIQTQWADNNSTHRFFLCQFIQVEYSGPFGGRRLVRGQCGFAPNSFRVLETWTEDVFINIIIERWCSIWIDPTRKLWSLPSYIEVQISKLMLLIKSLWKQKLRLKRIFKILYNRKIILFEGRKKLISNKR